MTNILIRSVDILTLDDAGTVLRDADLAVSDGRIAAVGRAPQDFRADEVVDGQGKVAAPGFFNAHTHAPMTLVRGWAEGLPLDRWFNERIWVAESALEEEDVRWGACLAAAEMIRSGTVAFADHYFWMDRVAEVVEESGLKATLAWCVFGLGAEQEIGGTTLARTVEFVRRWQGAANGRIRTVLGPHSPYVCSPEFLGQVAETAAALGVGCHIHAAESQAQVDASLARHGATPIGHLARLGILDRPAIVAHAIYLGPGDLETLAEKRATVVQCPNCHMKLGMGTTRVPDLLAAGVNVALGTDGTASNNNLDMLEEARLAALAQKHDRRDPEAMAGDLPLRLATQAGARAMGFAESGVIAPGRPADIVLWDFNRPHLRPRHNLAANLLHAARAGDVTDVMVDGRWLLRGGELQTLDEERILWEAERRAFRMVGSELKQVRAYRL
ncbi:MAG: amidohydrolase [Anaerolineae bacterium]|nr:amidohydrolase [Anaerolineae bacterium]